MKLMHEDWPEKLAKINRIMEKNNTSTSKWPTKVFDKVEFIVSHALIIRATISQSQFYLMIIKISMILRAQ